jgi:hypothetical protein
MTVDWTRELTGQFDLQWNLAHGPSLETPADEEYLWEPVPGCWSIRPTRGSPDAAMARWLDGSQEKSASAVWRTSGASGLLRGPQR